MSPDISDYLNRRGNVRRGRLLLIAIYMAMRFMDILFIFGMSLPGSSVWAPVINSFLWSTALMAAIWLGQNWARYMLGILLLVKILVYIIVFVPTLLETVTDQFAPATLKPIPLIIITANSIVDMASLWLLLSSRDIKRLVRP